MSLLKRKPTCPLHDCDLILSYHGGKPGFAHPLIEVVHAPMLYCPVCYDLGQDMSKEVQPAASALFLKRLARLLDHSPFPGLLERPHIRVDFHPGRTRRQEDEETVEPTAPIMESVPPATADIETTPAIAFGPEPVTTAAIGPGSNAQPAEEPRLSGLEPSTPRHTLDNLILDEESLTRIREATNVLLSQDLLYDTWNLASVARTGRRVALNFYGPPGTGKTLAAEAIAAMLGKKILRLSYAELESKYVGETPKNIQAAFALARESDAVLFFDEADSILGKRLTTISQSADNSINVARSTTLIELDNFSGAVIFASNLVGNYDNAFLRRILAHIEFHLPETAQRTRLWAAHFPPQLPLADDVDCETLAESSAGAAGGDIQNAVLLAASYAAMRRGKEQIVTQADCERAIRFLLEGKRRIVETREEMEEMICDPQQDPQ